MLSIHPMQSRWRTHKSQTEKAFRKPSLQNRKPSPCVCQHVEEALGICFIQCFKTLHTFVLSSVNPLSYWIFIHFIRTIILGEIPESWVEVNERLIWLETKWKLRRCLSFGRVIVPCLEFWPCNVQDMQPWNSIQEEIWSGCNWKQMAYITEITEN